MPVTVVTEDGTGLANANSYVDPAGAFATAYAAAWLYGSAWSGATDDRKAAAVVSATRTLDANFSWRGVQMREGTQALGWPRYVRGATNPTIPSDAVPGPVAAAAMEMALALLQRDRTSDTGSGSRPVKAIGLGDGALKIDFGDDPTTAPVGSIIPDNISGILRDYGDAAGGVMATVERR